MTITVLRSRTAKNIADGQLQFVNWGHNLYKTSRFIKVYVLVMQLKFS